MGQCLDRAAGGDGEAFVPVGDGKTLDSVVIVIGEFLQRGPRRHFRDMAVDDLPVALAGTDAEFGERLDGGGRIFVGRGMDNVENHRVLDRSKSSGSRRIT